MTHEELNAALDIHRKIARLQVRLDDLRQSGGVRTTQANTPVKGNNGLCVGQVVAELEQEIAELQEQIAVERVVIRRFLEKSDMAGIEKKIMILRYAECWGWEDIQVAACYSRRRIFQKHTEALKTLKIAPDCT